MHPVWDTSSYESDCLIGFFPGKIISRPGVKTIGMCKTKSKKLFRTFHVNVGATAIDTIFTMGALIGAPRGHVSFDASAFKNAYIEAMGKLPKDSIKNIILAIKKKNDDISKLRAKFRVDYNRSYESVKINLEINDKSKLMTKSYDLAKFIAINQNNLTPLPSNSYINKTLQGLIQQIEKKNREVELLWRREVLTINVSCNKNSAYGFKFKLICPSTVLSVHPIVDAQAIVYNKSYYHIMPRHLSGQDKNISFSFNGKILELTNNSKEFISIESISFYYGPKIITRSHLSQEFPPDSVAIALDIESLDIEWDSLNFENLTRKDAVKSKIKFGFAIKYKINSTSNYNTLLKTKDYSLPGLI